jgi:hypothetical protein
MSRLAARSSGVTLAGKNAATARTNEVKALQTELQQSLLALATRFDNFQRNNDGRNGNGKGGRGSNKGGSNSRNNGRNNRHGNDNRRKGKNNRSRQRYPYDTNKSCDLHGRGHSRDECIALKRQARQQQSSSGRNQHNQQRNTYGNYQPNFINRQITATVTRLSVNNTQIARTSADPFAWIVDSAANAFITPFKEHLHNYRQFKEEVQVKGFDGKP